MPTDCLIIGFNDSDFETYVNMVAQMGADSGAYRDLNLAFIEYENKPRRSMDMLNLFYFEGRGSDHRPFNNGDFLWPVITYLGTYLTRRGFTFDYVNLPHIEKDKLKDKLLKGDILTIAITTTLYVSPHPIIELISFIREHNQTAKILVGGPFISNQPKLADKSSLQRLFEYLGADIYVISQEGEAALVNILAALKENSSLDRVDNIAYKSGNKYVMTAASIESNALEENMVDYTLFPKEEIDQFVTLRTAKSCPFNCAFCGFPQRAGKYKYLSVELVEKELNAIRDIGTVTTLTFIDDTFNVPKERFRDMLRMMIRNGYGFKWNSFYRSDHGDEQTIELMAKAGCEGVFLGIESGSDEMLGRMNKTARRKEYMKAIPLLREAGISTHANVIVGFPGETYDTYQHTVDLIEETKPDFFRAQLWYADPVTPIWDRKDQYGVTGSAFNWSHDTMDYEVASDLVDKMFLSVQGSIWLPQNGFEQWSTFYLQRKGMTMAQIKDFLRCFNAIIKEKLLYPEKRAISPGLIDSLRAAAQFDRPDKPDMRPVELYESYSAADKFWAETFSAGEDVASTEMLRHSAPQEADGRDGGYEYLCCSIERVMVERVGSQCGVDLPTAIVAAYSVLLSRTNGKHYTDMLTAVRGLGAEGVLPLRLKPSWRLSFKDFARDVREQKEQAMNHRRHAFHILTSPVIMRQHGLECPVFDAGYLYGDAANSDGQGIDAELSLIPKLSKNMQLVLEAAVSGDEVAVAFAYRRGAFTRARVEGLGRHLQSILNQAAANPELSINDFSLGEGERQTHLAIEAHMNEAFNF